MQVAWGICSAIVQAAGHPCPRDRHLLKQPKYSSYEGILQTISVGLSPALRAGLAGMPIARMRVGCHECDKCDHLCHWQDN